MSKKDFSKKIFKKVTTKEGIATIGGAGVGGWLGSSMGIVALGTGIAGTIPVAIVGGTIGYLGVKAFTKKKSSNNKKKNKDAEF